MSLELSAENANAALYTYNAFNQLAQVSENGTTSSYTYNGDGLRMTKTVNGTQTKHFLDGQNVVADQTGSKTTKYNRGLGLIRINNGTQKGYYVQNTHGDVTKIVSPPAPLWLIIPLTHMVIKSKTPALLRIPSATQGSTTIRKQASSVCSEKAAPGSG